MTQTALKYGFYIFLVIIVSSCGSEIKEEPKFFSEEQRLLVGEWTEKVSADSTIAWAFTSSHVTWGSYTHPYAVDKNELVISGMKYELLTEIGEEVKVLSPKGDTLKLIKR